MSVAKIVLTTLFSTLLVSTTGSADATAQAGCYSEEEVKPELSTVPGTVNQERFTIVIGEAECLNQAASITGAEWLETGELITLARQAAAKGSWDVAVNTALEARFQASAALRQAESETRAWRKRVPR